MSKYRNTLESKRTQTPRLLRMIKSCDGVAIMDILIATLIFSIGILGMASMQTNATGSNRNSIKLSGATEKGVFLLEQLTTLPYTHPILIAGAHPTIAEAALWNETDFMDNDENGVVDEVGETGDYAVVWTVLDDAVIPNTKTISITITSASSLKQVTLAGVMPIK